MITNEEKEYLKDIVKKYKSINTEISELESNIKKLSEEKNILLTSLNKVRQEEKYIISILTEKYSDLDEKFIINAITS